MVIPSSPFRNKLVIGMAAYGRSMWLADDKCTGFGCPIKGAGETGCPGEPGFLPYFELVDMMNNGNYDSLTTNYDTGSVEMITGTSTGKKFYTTFDSTETFNIKYQYAFANCMRGIMW